MNASKATPLLMLVRGMPHAPFQVHRARWPSGNMRIECVAAGYFMSVMGIARSNRRVATSRLAASAHDLLEASTLCAIATVDRRGRSYINTAYFAWNRDFQIVWLSEPRAQHSKNLAAHDSAAIAVFDSAQTWGNPDRGIQLFGRAHALTADDDARELYTARFPRFADANLGAYRFYRFRAERLKLFDETNLGGGTFVSASLDRARKPIWEKTIVYQSKNS